MSVAVKKSRQARLDTNKGLVRKTPQNIPLKVHEDFRKLLFKMRKNADQISPYGNGLGTSKSATSKCGQIPINENSIRHIHLLKGEKSQKPYFHGLIKCGNVWRCPVCAKKISDFRQKEIYYLASEWQRKDKKLSFLTLTIKHLKSDSPQNIVDRLITEFRKLQRTSKWKKLKELHDIEGFCKSLEFTFSKKHWLHPHLHILLFHNSENPGDLHDQIIRMWVKRKETRSVLKAQNAKSVYDKSGISNYVTKWDVSAELTKANHKLGKVKENVSPFQALKMLTTGKYGSFTHKELAHRWMNYRAITYRKHHIQLSRNLKVMLKDGDFKESEEILKDEKPDQLIARIDKDLWTIIIKKELPPRILNAWEKGGHKEIAKLLITHQINYLWEPHRLRLALR
jgi:hypothetical protein